MATPSVMLRFRDIKNPSVDEHNELFKKKGRVLWGLWLKAFEDKDEIIKKLEAKTIDRIYIANTTSKSHPEVYVCRVGRILVDRSDVKKELVPKYYREKIPEVSIWFELVSSIDAIDVDVRLKEILGVPTIYFLEYDRNNKIINSAPPREYPWDASKGARWIVHLSDIHLGDDHAFRYPVVKEKFDVDPKRVFSDVLIEDLARLNVLGQVGCVIISGDIVTKGAWEVSHEVGGRNLLGLDLAKEFLADLSEKIKVDPKLFFIVPGNHDIVRSRAESPAQVQESLLHYAHETGFRILREDFCGIYKLSPLNYVAKVAYDEKTLVLGLLNSAYLNERTEFAEYGYVGDDADEVFKILENVNSDRATKILVLHHHLLPVYEKESIAADGKISMTLDAAKLLRRAQEASVSIVLHGHQHSTKKMTYSSASAEMNRESRAASHAVTVIAGGSSGAKRERLPPDETNAYSLIDLHGGVPSVRMRRIFAEGRAGEDW